MPLNIVPFKQPCLNKGHVQFRSAGLSHDLVNGHTGENDGLAAVQRGKLLRIGESIQVYNFLLYFIACHHVGIDFSKRLP
jgi:hypothetical protein